ncbi:hypothetical protein G3545_23670 [Starkeya sp. ORNL1]|jgi:hypothetical protein|uniref:hypothetical protein n=1 Tax=Starkeya sp. ORNL1 TaxID=2709380 RepID=UPI0014640D18|nr:hypothetical protein [Starkeya sp. ORNL1]QJP16369.1 hypothetical protein G3545_23670 [Starkeya sp. ORNL1]
MTSFSIDARHAWADAHVEPSIDDILADPIIHLVLRRDGLTPGAVKARLDQERRRLGFLPQELGRAA